MNANLDHGTRRQWHPPPVLLPGESHGRRSLVGCSPWGRYESDTTERLHFHFHALEKEMATHSSVLVYLYTNILLHHIFKILWLVSFLHNS